MTIEGRSFELRRPMLLGAVLIKARSLMVHSDPEAQREDLLALLAIVEEPRQMASELRGSERGWLRVAEQRLKLGVDRDAVQVRQLAGPEARGGPSDDDAAAHRAQIMAWLTRPPGGVVLVA